MSIEQEMWYLERPLGISLIWPSDLVYDPKWPKFKLVWDFINTNYRTNFQVNHARNVASTEPTRYFFNLTWWPSLWPQLTQTQTHPTVHQDTNFLTNFQVNWARNFLTQVTWIWTRPRRHTFWSNFRSIEHTRGPWWPWMAHLSNFPHKKSSAFFVTIVTCDNPPPPPRGQFWPKGYHMNKIEKGPQRDAIYQIWKLYALVSEKKNFEACLLCSHVQNYENRGGANFDPRGIIVQNWLRSTWRCCIPNNKALCLPPSEKKNFDVGLLCSYVPTKCDP